MRIKLWSPLLLAALLISLTVPAFPQTGTGVIRGTVFDSARAAVPNAKVVLVQTSTNISRETTTNDVGFFLFSGITPGPYKMSAEFQGFKKWTSTMTLEAGQTAVIEPALEVGSVDTVVEVSGAAPVITMESSEISDVKDVTRIQQLPLNGRSVTNLFDLTPGVEGGGNPRVNGLKVGSTEMTLDGMSLVDRFGGGMARVQPGLDTVQEFRVETVGSNAQSARPATVTLVTKSGTNEFHGTLFETFRNNGGGLRARQRQSGNAAAAFYVRNEYGGSAGGPVMLPKLYDGRNKTFWFFAYEGLRERSKRITSNAKVPTVALWDGDFSGVIDRNGNRTTIYDPTTTNVNGIRTPFAGNIIPKNRQNASYAVLKSVSHLPTKDVNPYIGGNMDEVYSNLGNGGNLTLKGDQQVGGKDSLSFRFTRSDRYNATTGGVYGYPVTSMTDGFGTSRGNYYVYNGTARWTRSFTPTLLSELMVATHHAPKSSGTLADFTNWTDQLGFPNPFQAKGWPSLYAGIFGWDADNRKEERLTALVIDENMTWVKSKHTVKFGGRYRSEYNSVQELAQEMGEQWFGGEWTSLYDPKSDGGVAYTGDGMADMALGLPNYVSANYNRGFFDFRQKEIGLYVQDTWKVTPRLTLDIGLRYDRWTPYSEKRNRLVNVDPRSLATTFQVVTPGDVRLEDMEDVPAGIVSSWKARGLTWKTANEVGMPARLLVADNNNFGPRLGFAFKLNDKTVIRGSYGQYYWTMPLSQILQAARRNPPLSLFFSTDVARLDGTDSFGIRTAPLPSYYAGQVKIDTTGTVYISSSARSMATMDPFDWKDNMARSFHASIERELMRNTSLRFSYIGSQGRDLEQAFSLTNKEAEYNYVARTGMAPPANRDELRINKNWNLSSTNHTGYSNTHSGQVEFERRYMNGLSFQWFYVFTRSMTTSDTGGFQAGGGNINSTNGVFSVPLENQIIGSPKMSYDDRLRLGYQNSTNVPVHSIRYNWLYELPFGKGQKFASGANRALDAVIGGWQVAGNAMWRSGYWMGVSASEYLFGNPSLNEDQRLLMTYAGRSQRLWFAGDFTPTTATNVDQTALQALIPLDRSKRVMHPVGSNFSNQVQQVLANGTVRNTGVTEMVNWNSRAFYKGPGAWNADISAFKNFSFTESIKLRFTADFFNGLNHPNDASPNVTTGLQDLSIQTNDPRTIQFSLRLSW
jgi:hypothetical protein